MQMQIYVNEVEMTIFNGARVIDAANRFINEFDLYEKLRRLSVRDAYGNKLSLDGELHEGSKIFLD